MQVPSSPVANESEEQDEVVDELAVAAAHPEASASMFGDADIDAAIAALRGQMHLCLLLKPSTTACTPAERAVVHSHYVSHANALVDASEMDEKMAILGRSKNANPEKRPRNG